MQSPLAPLGTPSLITDVTVENFMKEVMEASQKKIVIVDFWAPWCSACLQLVPVLEKLVVSYKGAVSLAKIDIEVSPEIAQQMRVQSIPAVFAFYKGQPVDGFMGALPEAQIKSWIDRLIKATGLIPQDPHGDEIKLGLEAAQVELKAKNFEKAEELFATLMDHDPDNAQAYAGVLSSMIGQKKIAQARKMLEMTPEEMVKSHFLHAVRAELELAEQSLETTDSSDKLRAICDKNPNDHETRYALALALYAEDHKEQAIDELLEIIRRNRTWNDDAARKQLIKFFEALGFSDPLAVEARKKLSSILFS